MKQQKVELYQRGELPALQRKICILRWIASMIALIALGICIGFCVRTNTANAKTMLLGAILTSTVGGWIVLTIRIFGISERNNEEKHILAMLDGAREVVEGTFTLTEERLRVKNGVAMRKVRVDGAGKITSLQVMEQKAAVFGAAETHRVETVYRFIVAYEANDDADC